MGPIEQLRKQKNDLVLIILTAIFFALGINLASSGLSGVVGSDNFRIIFGCILIVASIYFVIRLFSLDRTKVIRVRGAIGLVLKDGKVSKLGISGYKFNDDFYKYLNSFLNENKAYKNIFVKDGSKDREIVPAKSFQPDNLTFHTIVNSVIELVLLKQLDYHLNSYVIHNEIDKNNIKVIKRDQINHDVLKNRVLELVTRDMCEREAFLDGNEIEPNGNVVYSIGKSGAIYHRIDLELPKGSKLNRNGNGYLEIDNRLFKMTLMPGFEGFSTNVANELITNREEYISPLLASFKVQIHIKNVFFVSNDDLALYGWLDSFLVRLVQYASVGALEERVNIELLRLLRS